MQGFYDDKKIKAELKRFKKQKLNIKELNIFLDIDNTLALFSEKGKDAEACEAAKEEGFYEDLPIFSCVKDNLMYLTRLGAKIWIISSYLVREGTENPHSAKDEKNKWVQKHLPFIPKKRRIFVENGTNKATVMSSLCDLNTCIIIDDYGKNIQQAYEMGIVGIKKTYSGKRRSCPQIKTFNDIFDVLKKLNVQIIEQE